MDTDKDREYGLYVPAEHAPHDVRPRSAIVGERSGDMIDTHYEGGGSSENVKTFEHRINHAAGRRRERYPTIARRSWEVDDLIRVGTVAYDDAMRHWVITRITDVDALRGWVGEDEPLVENGSDALTEEVGSRAFSQLTPMEQGRIMSMRLPMTALCAEVIDTIRRKNGA
jgi:hypothetical protein